jgi:hypothetical protein
MRADSARSLRELTSVGKRVPADDGFYFGGGAGNGSRIFRIIEDRINGICNLPESGFVHAAAGTGR